MPDASAIPENLVSYGTVMDEQAEAVRPRPPPARRGARRLPVERQRGQARGARPRRHDAQPRHQHHHHGDFVRDVGLAFEKAAGSGQREPGMPDHGLRERARHGVDAGQARADRAGEELARRMRELLGDPPKYERPRSPSRTWPSCWPSSKDSIPTRPPAWSTSSGSAASTTCSRTSISCAPVRPSAPSRTPAQRRRDRPALPRAVRHHRGAGHPQRLAQLRSAVGPHRRQPVRPRRRPRRRPVRPRHPTAPLRQLRDHLPRGRGRAGHGRRARPDVRGRVHRPAAAPARSPPRRSSATPRRPGSSCGTGRRTRRC